MKPSEPTTPEREGSLSIERSLQSVISSLSANRCYACGWPLGSCKPFDCAMRYRDDTEHIAERERWHERAKEMADVLQWGVATSTERLSTQSESERRIELEEGFRYWTHEGHIARFNQATETTELLGPGGWTPAL